MEMEELNLAEVLQDTVRSAIQMARPKGVEIRLEQDVSVVPFWGLWAFAPDADDHFG